MRLTHLTVKQLTIVASLFMTIAFLLTYLAFRYYWTFDQAQELAQKQQVEEVNRVRTMVYLQTNNLARSLEDFSAWDELIDYVEDPKEAFILENLNEHFFDVAQLNAVLIFDHNISPVFVKGYDPNTQSNVSFEEYRYRYGSLLADTLRSRTDQITPVVKFMMVNDQPAFIATARICSSDGSDCTHGYSLFVRPITSQVMRSLKLATGLSVTIHNSEDFPQGPPESEPNITYIKLLDYANQPSVVLRIEHSIKLPHFISWQELAVLPLFSSIMFLFALAIVHMIVRPLKQASQMLNNFANQKDYMPNEQDFISFEMRDFARRITQIFKELEATKRTLQFHADHDALTKLANRHRLHTYWQELRANKAQHHLVLLIDVDFFKPYNDHYGHVQGDEALKAVAHCLRDVSNDMSKLLARFGGEEFCVVLSSEQPILVEAIAETYRRAVEELAIVHEFSDIHDVLTISLGAVSITSDDLEQQQAIFRCADEALYHAKSLGRNCWSYSKYKDLKPKLHLAVD
ncbi:sensor domain-containing diguanylate cyclase [Vibrio astriarenae]